jgi:tRNA (guanine-N7-)-methyltransferase
MALKSHLIPEPNLLNVADSAGILNLEQVFSRAAPVELEIGSGKGAFLLQMATAFPEKNFIGIEWANAYAAYAADRFRRHSHNHVRIVNGEALWWMRVHLADTTLDALHVYFPDPWPKSRHHKRRLIQKSFLQQSLRILKPAAPLHIVTDHAEYFEHMRHTFAEFGQFNIEPFISPLRSVGADFLVGTNFEKKYVAENRPFYSLIARKPG